MLPCQALEGSEERDGIRPSACMEAVIKSAADAASPEGFQAVFESGGRAASARAKKSLQISLFYRDSKY